MNPKIQKDFLEALRSEKYKQCFGQLRKDNSFCPTGILVDLYLKETNQNWNKYDSEIRELPKEVSDWAECSFMLRLNVPKMTRISYYNDIEKMTFEQIAELVEKTGLLC